MWPDGNVDWRELEEEEEEIYDQSTAKATQFGWFVRLETNWIAKQFYQLTQKL